MEHPINSGEGHETKAALKSLKEFSFSSFITTFLRFGIRILKNVVFTRFLSPAERGLFGLLTTIPDLVISFGNMGFGLGNTYLVAKHRYDLKKIVGNTLLFTFVLGLCLAGIGYIILSSDRILKGDGEAVRSFSSLVLFAIPFVLLYKFTDDILIATKQIHFANFLRLVFSGLPIVLIVVFWLYSGLALKAALYAWALTIVVVAVWAVIKTLSKDALPLKLSVPYFKDSISFGSRGLVSMFANELVRRVDYVFVSSMHGAHALGFYAVSVSVAEILLSVPDAVSTSFLPIHLGLDKKSANSFAPVVIRHVLCVMVVVCICTAIAGKLIIWLLFGGDYLPSYNSMLFLLPGILALSIYDLLKVDLYNHNLPGFVSWVSVITLVCNLLLNFLLIPRYGISGAAVSSSLSYGLSTIILLVKVVRLSGNSYQEVLLIKKTDIVLLWNKLRVKCRKAN